MTNQHIDTRAFYHTLMVGGIAPLVLEMVVQSAEQSFRSLRLNFRVSERVGS